MIGHIDLLASSSRAHRYTHNEVVDDPHAISSLFKYLDSKQAKMKRMMEAAEEIDKVKFKPKLEDRDPRAEAKQDWAKMQGGMSAYRASVERQISYSQFRKRLIAFGYK